MQSQPQAHRSAGGDVQSARLAVRAGLLCAALVSGTGCDTCAAAVGAPPSQQRQRWEFSHGGEPLAVWASCSDDACSHVLVVRRRGPAAVVHSEPGWAPDPLPQHGYTVAERIWWEGRALEPGIYLHGRDGPCRGRPLAARLSPEELAELGRGSGLWELLQPCLP